MTVPRFALLLVPVAAMATFFGCSSSATTSASSTTGGQPMPDYADVVFESGATPAGLTSMLAKKVLDDQAHASYFDTPANNAELPPTPIPSFTWHDGAKGARLELLPNAPRPQRLGAIFLDLFAERSAYADAAMTGNGYLLAFRALDTDKELFRVFTTKTSYTPDAKAWSKLTTNTWTTLKIIGASFQADQVVSGPFNGETIEFCAMKPTG